MKLSSLIHAPQVVLGLQSRCLREAVPELLEKAGRFHPSESKEAIAEAVLGREAQNSTALEHSVAVPHARISGLRDFHLLLGLAAEPLEDTCLDGSAVDIVFLILAADDKNTLMLQTMAAIGMFALDPSQLEKLRTARNRDDAWRILDESDARVKEGLSARDLMREAPVVAREDMTMSDLLDAFFEKGIHEAPVCTEEGAIIGSVTAREIIEAGFPDYMSRIRDISFLNEFRPFEEFFKRERTTRIGQILNKKPLVVGAEDPMIQVVFRMKQERQRLAYVQDEGRFVGIVDRNDIISRVLRA